MKKDRLHIALVIGGVIIIAVIYLWNSMQQQNICVDFCLKEITRRQQEASGDTDTIQGQMNYCQDACSKKTY